ncbi:MAG: transposase [Eubacterium sp.]
MKLPTRKPNRLKDFDYSQNGMYFITICTKDKKPLLSQITVGVCIASPNKIKLTEKGIIVEKGIIGISKHYKNVFVDNYVIMPNHIHLIIRIDDVDGLALQAPTISHIIQHFKGYVTKQIGKPIWQKIIMTILYVMNMIISPNGNTLMKIL